MLNLDLSDDDQQPSILETARMNLGQAFLVAPLHSQVHPVGGLIQHTLSPRPGAV